MTDLKSSAVRQAIELAKEYGISVREMIIGYSNAECVAFMTTPLVDDLRNALRSVSQLRYWTSTGTPHNPADEGFTDDQFREVISFPLSGG